MKKFNLTAMSGALCLFLSAGAFAVTPTEANYNSMKMSISANYNATHAVATEKRDEFSCNSEAVCDKEANSKVIAAKADADVALKTTDANAKAQQKTTDARMDAAADKRDATYGVAKEKCDVLAGDAKDSCIKMAKVNNGQN